MTEFVIAYLGASAFFGVVFLGVMLLMTVREPGWFFRHVLAWASCTVFWPCVIGLVIKNLWIEARQESRE